MNHPSNRTFAPSLALGALLLIMAATGLRIMPANPSRHARWGVGRPLRMVPARLSGRAWPDDASCRFGRGQSASASVGSPRRARVAFAAWSLMPMEEEWLCILPSQQHVSFALS
jgi:hypothetical protein